MIKGELELHWVTLCLSLSSAALSVITQPVGTGKFTADLKLNLRRLPTPQSGFLVLTNVFRLLRWRFLNLGDFDTCLWLASRFHFADLGLNLLAPSLGKTVGPKYNFTRLTFFVVITIPLYAQLLASKGSPWTKFWTTCFILQFFIHELLWKYYKHRHIVHRIRTEWPAKSCVKVIYRRDDLPPPPQDIQLDNDLTKAEWFASSNSCEAVNLLLSQLKDRSRLQNDEKGSDDIRLELEAARFWSAVANTKFIWTCGHFRCLLYKIFSAASDSNTVYYLEFFATCSLLTWLLHCVLKPFSIMLCDRLRVRSTAMAWLVEITLLVLWVAFAIFLTQKIVREKVVDEDTSIQKSMEEKARSQKYLGSSETDETSTPKATARSPKAQEDHIVASFYCFNLLMFTSATLLWYAFCNQSETLPPKDSRIVAHSTDPRVLTLLQNGWKFV